MKEEKAAISVSKKAKRQKENRKVKGSLPGPTARQLKRIEIREEISKGKYTIPQIAELCNCSRELVRSVIRDMEEE